MWLLSQNQQYFFLLLATILLPTRAKFTSEQSDLLEKIKIAAKEAGLAESEWKNIDKFDKDVCYEKACLDSALEIISAANFREDPCDPNKWLDYVCHRRTSGIDRLNQLDKLQGKINTQTIALLDNKDSSKDLLLAEAQAYRHQCISKGENDEDDVRFILNYTDKFGGWPVFTHEPPTDKFDWLDIVADQNRFEKQGFHPMFFDVSVNSSFPAVQLDIGQLYFHFTTRTVRDYENMVTAMQSEANLEHPANTTQIKDCLDYMYSFNSKLWEIFKETNSTKDTYTLPELQMLSDDYLEEWGVSRVDWSQFFENVFKGSTIKFEESDTEIYLPFYKVMKVVKHVEQELKNETARVAISNALNLNLVSMLMFETTSIVDDLTTFRCNEESGTREMICLSRVETIFGHSLSKTFLAKYFNDSEVTPGVHKLVDNIKEGYLQNVERLNWMSNETKEFLYDKIDSIRVHVGPTDKMREPGAVEKYYEGLRASKNGSSSYSKNFMEVNSWQLRRERTIAHQLWKTDLPEADTDDIKFVMGNNYYQGIANAFYAPAINQIQVEAGIIQEPFFDLNRPGFMNYGGLGMVLAHEIGHSFDTNGRKYDKFGNDTVENWDEESVVKYNNWVKSIADFGRNIPFKVSSKVVKKLEANKTIDEDIADALGIHISFNSYKNYLGGLKSEGRKEKVLPGLKTFSPEKLFYMKYANMWCEKTDVQTRFNHLLDEHSPPNRRATLPLRRSKEFLKTFGCEFSSDPFLQR